MQHKKAIKMKQKNGLINLISGDDALQAIDIVRKMAVENNIDSADGNVERSSDGLRDS